MAALSAVAFLAQCLHAIGAHPIASAVAALATAVAAAVAGAVGLVIHRCRRDRRRQVHGEGP